MYGNELSGTVPQSLFSYPQQLYLSHNEFDQAPIPSGKIGANTNLQYLHLLNCQFTGTVPSSLFHLSNIQDLRLGQNLLKGQIPTEVGLATSLRHLVLTSNQFSGEVPKEIERLTGLSHLELDDNLLSGELGTELGQLSELQFLSVWGNLLQGTLPTQIAQLRQLRSLRLSIRQQRNRDLTGTIPRQYFVSPESEDGTGMPTPTFPHLVDFWIAGTGISGVIPTERAMMTTLQSVRLGWNENMNGPVPTQLGLMTALTELNLAEDNIASSIPTELGLLTILKKLELQHNALSGRLPTELEAIVPSLEVFRVDGNVALSGTVADEFCKIQELGLGCDGDRVDDRGRETSLCGCHCDCD